MVCLQYSTSDDFIVVSDEQILLNKLAQGNRNAFWKLWELHQDYFYCRCRTWMGGNHEEAQEVMSLALCKAWDKLPQHSRNIKNFKGWLYQLIHNLCIDIYRQRNRSTVGVENIDDVPCKNQERENFSSNNPEAALLQQELKIYIRHCIDALPSRLSQPLILHYYQGMSHTDIGQKLSISQANVAKRLQQAKLSLRKSLCRYFSGLNTVAINETRCQKLEQTDFQLPINTNSTIEEIDYRITVSCLETLPLVWCNFQQIQD